MVSLSSLSESGLSNAASNAGRLFVDALVLFDDARLSEIRPPVGRTDGRPTSAKVAVPLPDELAAAVDSDVLVTAGVVVAAT